MKTLRNDKDFLHKIIADMAIDIVTLKFDIKNLRRDIGARK